MSSSLSFRKKTLFFFVIFSLLFHLVLLILLGIVVKMTEKNLPREQQAVIVDLRTFLPKNIADIPKPKQESIPEKADVQALYNQKALEETTAPSLLPNKARPVPQKGAQPQAPRKKQATKKETSKPQPKPQTQREESNKKFLFNNPDENTGWTEPKPARTPGIPDEASSKDAPLLPREYLHDYKVGDKTYINALANPNIRYFVELKRKFRETFNPRQVLLANIRRILASRIDVVLGVSVNVRGELVELIILRSSNIDSYDNEAERTVRASAPFSSPPTEFIGPDGLLHMAWTFIVYL